MCSVNKNNVTVLPPSDCSDTHSNSQLKPGANESQKTRNKKQNSLAYSRFNVCITPKQNKHCLIRESRFSGICAKHPINSISEVTWLCTWFPN